MSGEGPAPAPASAPAPAPAAQHTCAPALGARHSWTALEQDTHAPQHLQHDTHAPQHLERDTFGQHLEHDTHAPQHHGAPAPAPAAQNTCARHAPMCTHTHTRTRTAWGQTPTGICAGMAKIFILRLRGYLGLRLVFMKFGHWDESAKVRYPHIPIYTGLARTVYIHRI